LFRSAHSHGLFLTTLLGERFWMYVVSTRSTKLLLLTAQIENLSPQNVSIKQIFIMLASFDSKTGTLRFRVQEMHGFSHIQKLYLLPL